MGTQSGDQQEVSGPEEEIEDLEASDAETESVSGGIKQIQEVTGLKARDDT